jgi:hypothetical protein
VALVKFNDFQKAMYFVANFNKILGGYTPGQYKYIHDTFWSTAIREMFVQMHNSFVDRSVTGSDGFGDIWPPLSPKTVKKKSRPHKRGGVMLPASQTPDLINRDTGRLLESFKPGPILGDQYVPYNSDQKTFWKARQLILSSRVPYAKKVHKVRQLFGNQGRDMLERALMKAFKTIEPLVNRP